MAWVCPLCSTANEDSESECMVCGQERVYPDAIAAAGVARAPWVCPLCSNVNEGGAPTCLVCDTARPTETPTGVVTLTRKRVEALRLSGDVEIPTKYNVIGPEAFAGRSDITGVILHEGVKKIGKEAFLGCTSLVEGRDIAARYVAVDAFFLPEGRTGSVSASRGASSGGSGGTAPAGCQRGTGGCSAGSAGGSVQYFPAEPERADS